jgi:peptidoglycan/xylan/chitin deacetylase (PgdA/CDA1 family)
MPGALCISIDLELAWGVWDRPTRDYFELCAQKERMIVRRLLALFSRYDVSATWAVVGRLLDPLGPVPVASATGRHVWYAPDLVEAINRAAPTQEIGSHSFAHIYCQRTSRAAMREDLDAAKAIHIRHGLEWHSFVFPRNQVAHVDLLRDAGMHAFRSADVGWHMQARRAGLVAGRLANLADKLLPVPPTAVCPVHAAGMVDIPGSMLLLGRGGIRRLVRPGVVEAKARLGLRAAWQRGRVFHLWFHPSNFYYETDVQFGVLERVLRIAAAARARGEVDIRPMKSIADAQIGAALRRNQHSHLPRLS